MNRITFSLEGKIRLTAVVLVGLILSAVAFALDMLIATTARRLSGRRARLPRSASRRCWE